MYTTVAVQEIVGPFPANNQCVAVVGNGVKNIGIPITIADAGSFYALFGKKETPYTYTANILDAVNVKVVATSLVAANDEFYSVIKLKKEGKRVPMKLCFDSPVHALNTHKQCGCPLTISDEDFKKAKDCTQQYGNIAGRLTFPMQKLCDTISLQEACDFMEVVFSE